MITSLNDITECDAPPSPNRPAHGAFQCQKRNFNAGSLCTFVCSGSRVPEKASSTTCMEVTNSTGAVVGYEWEPKVNRGPESKFTCVNTMM